MAWRDGEQWWCCHQGRGGRLKPRHVAMVLLTQLFWWYRWPESRQGWKQGEESSGHSTAAILRSCAVNKGGDSWRGMRTK